MSIVNIFKIKYYLPFVLLLASNCNSSKPSIDSPEKMEQPAWKMPTPPKIDLSKEIIDTVLQTAHFRFITHNTTLPQQTIEQTSEQCEYMYEQILVLVGQPKESPIINYHFYSSIEEKALRLSDIAIASIEEATKSIHVVRNAYFNGSQLHQENKLLLRASLGIPTLTALEEGLCNSFTKNWQQKGYAYWCGQLYNSQNLPPLAELLSNDTFQKESDLVMGAMSGVFIDFLLERFQKEAFLKKYATWEAADLMELEGEWQNYLSKQYSEFLVPPPPTSKEKTYLKGFNFAHEGYRIYNGYGSKLAKHSLQRLEQIGSNAIAIVPYSFMRNPNQPSYLLIDHRAGGENDESVLYAHYAAKELGMSTMLKPQIWLRRSWPGEIDMSSEQDWEIFFDNYYRWMRHYALLAEMNGFDSVCIGVEFAKATLAKEKEWRQLIQKLRGIYSGELTYAANWGEEFENIKFWDALDFIGLNCYYPLSKKETPSKRELKKAFDGVVSKIKKVSKRFNKPVVFTEIGFRSVAGTWKNPHEEANGRPYNEQSQALAFEVIFEGIRNQDWCRGILWWKWPSYLAYRGAQNTGFSPNDKAAEQVVAEWFTQ